MAPHGLVVPGKQEGLLCGMLRSKAWMREVAQGRAGWVVHEPRLDDAFGAHHSKAFLAEYKGGLRVIVHTANLIHQVRWQALLRSASPASSMQCPAACLVALSFKVQTCMHISGCDSLPACLPLCALVGKPLPCFAHAGPEPEDTGALDAGLPKARPPPACPSSLGTRLLLVQHWPHAFMCAGRTRRPRWTTPHASLSTSCALTWMRWACRLIRRATRGGSCPDSVLTLSANAASNICLSVSWASLACSIHAVSW